MSFVFFGWIRNSSQPSSTPPEQNRLVARRRSDWQQRFNQLETCMSEVRIDRGELLSAGAGPRYAQD